MLHSPPIHVQYNDASLEEFLTETCSTKEDFEREVIGGIWSFMTDHREKIAECIVSIDDGYVHVTFHRNTVPYDEELQDACATWEWNLAQAEGGSWPEVTSLLLPATSQENLNMMHGVHASGED